jgi:hypothetical protein
VPDRCRLKLTELVTLAHTMDPEFVAAAVGMDLQAAVIHRADHAEPGRETARADPRRERAGTSG